MTAAFSPTVDLAAREYLDRRDRNTHPTGKFDGGGRWTPSETERQDCCSHIRAPSRTWPFSLLPHCRSAVHIANLFGVDRAELLRCARAIERQEAQNV
jgi:hypothetical protein